jgi:ABC-2 type transport system permease protein
MIGYLAKPTSAPAIVNMLYLPMSFLSGLWIPIQFLPAWLQSFAHFLPPYHLSRLALGVFGASEDNWMTNVAALALFTCLFLAAARFASSSHRSWPQNAAVPAASTN